MEPRKVTEILTSTIGRLRKEGLTNDQVANVLREVSVRVHFESDLPPVLDALRPPPEVRKSLLDSAKEAVARLGPRLKIQCIREVRLTTGCDLKEAKDAVEAVIAGLGPPLPGPRRLVLLPPL